MRDNIPRNGSSLPSGMSRCDPEDYRLCEGCGERMHMDTLMQDPWEASEWWCAGDECWPVRAKEIDNYDGPSDVDLAAAYDVPGMQETYERHAEEKRRMR